MTHIFIVNPYAGKNNFSDDLRSKLKRIEGLNYFVFNSRYEGYEVEMVKRVRRIFQGEKLRFYCCGGSGTMRNMLNGFDSFDDVEIAFYPCGLTNDFLKVFGEREKLFYNIEELINGEVMDIDYIKSNYGVALNTLSAGLDAYSQSRMEDYRVLTMFSRQLPYSISLLGSVLFSKSTKFNITVDDEEITDTFTELCFANGFVLGGGIFYDTGADIQDGKGVYGLTRSNSVIKRIKTFLAMTGADFEKADKEMYRGYSKGITIQKTDGTPFVINHDGELIRDVTKVEAHIVRKGLHFVVPKGVKL